MIKDLHSVGLRVADLDAAIGFYETAGAFKVYERSDAITSAEFKTARRAVLKGQSTFLELEECLADGEAKQTQRNVFDAGIRHMCLRYEDAEALMDDFIAADAKWHARPTDLGTGLDYAYIRDTEGNILELEGLPMMPPGVMKPWVDHAAIVTADLDELSRFYEMLLGSSLQRRETFGPAKPFDTVAGLEGIVFEGAWILFGLSRLEMWQYHTPETSPRASSESSELGWFQLCFEVDDLDAEVERLTAQGVTWVSDVIESHAGRHRCLIDVDGNKLKLLEVAEQCAEMSVGQLSSRPVLKLVRDAANS